MKRGSSRKTSLLSAFLAAGLLMVIVAIRSLTSKSTTSLDGCVVMMQR
jgi:hypothetical protein